MLALNLPRLHHRHSPQSERRLLGRRKICVRDGESQSSQTIINLRLSAQRSVKVISRVFLNQERLSHPLSPLMTVPPYPCPIRPLPSFSLQGNHRFCQLPVCHRTDQRAGTMRADCGDRYEHSTETTQRKVEIEAKSLRLRARVVQKNILRVENDREDHYTFMKLSYLRE